MGDLIQFPGHRISGTIGPVPLPLEKYEVYRAGAAAEALPVAMPVPSGRPVLRLCQS